MRRTLEVREVIVNDYRGEHGRSTVSITCPFCNTTQTAYVWSIRGGGKMCEGYQCDTMLTGEGKAKKLFPKLTEPQLSMLTDIKQFKCVNLGDGWHPNKRVLKSLMQKGYVTYGKYPPNEPFKEVGYFVTDLGKRYFE
ncbi:hypothetical protein OKZ62_001882 [Vibrio navarrensis]|nr:hypothetical protein [Vibrio navarrensis]